MMTADSIPTGLSMDKQKTSTNIDNNIIITAKIIVESGIVMLYVWFGCRKREGGSISADRWMTDRSIRGSDQWSIQSILPLLYRCCSCHSCSFAAVVAVAVASDRFVVVVVAAAAISLLLIRVVDRSGLLVSIDCYVDLLVNRCCSQRLIKLLSSITDADSPAVAAADHSTAVADATYPGLWRVDRSINWGYRIVVVDPDRRFRCFSFAVSL